MRTRHTLTAIAAAALALTACGGDSEPSYDDLVAQCADALADLHSNPDAEPGRPTECDGVTQEDYDTLNFGAIIGGDAPDK